MSQTFFDAGISRLRVQSFHQNNQELSSLYPSIIMIPPSDQPSKIDGYDCSARAGRFDDSSWETSSPFHVRAPSSHRRPNKESVKPKNLTPTTTTVLRIPQDGALELIQLETIPSFFNFASEDESDAHLLHVPNATRFWRHTNCEHFHTAWYQRTVVGCESHSMKEEIAGIYYVLLNKSFKDFPRNRHVISTEAKNTNVFGDVFIFKVKDQEVEKGELGEAVYEDVTRAFVDSGEWEDMLKFAAEDTEESEVAY